MVCAPERNRAFPCEEQASVPWLVWRLVRATVVVGPFPSLVDRTRA